MQPKALTKSALLKEAQLKEQLRREYTQMQEAVKATDFMIPFVFYDGKNVPGGMVRMRKADHIWLFVERARKVGADLAGKGDKSRRDWARISVDDLMVVKGDLIIPHVSLSVWPNSNRFADPRPAPRFPLLHHQQDRRLCGRPTLQLLRRTNLFHAETPLTLLEPCLESRNARTTQGRSRKRPVPPDRCTEKAASYAKVGYPRC